MFIDGFEAGRMVRSRGKNVFLTPRHDPLTLGSVYGAVRDPRRWLHDCATETNPE
jgi:hypothetical protein